MKNIIKIAILLIPTALFAGCATTVIPPVTSNSFSISSEGVSKAGVWLMMNGRVVKDPRGRLSNRLGLQWKSSPAQDGAQGVRYAVISPERFRELSRGTRLEYEQSADSAGLLLLQSQASANFSRPQFYVRSRGNSVVDIMVTGSLAADMSYVDLNVTAVQQEVGDIDHRAKWEGSARIPATVDYIFLEIPARADDPSGMPERMLVMLSGHFFRWNDGTFVSRQPWGRQTAVEISGDKIDFFWAPYGTEYQRRGSLQ